MFLPLSPPSGYENCSVLCQFLLTQTVHYPSLLLVAALKYLYLTPLPIVLDGTLPTLKPLVLYVQDKVKGKVVPVLFF
jgi:hypothetical protein